MYHGVWMGTHYHMSGRVQRRGSVGPVGSGQLAVDVHRRGVTVYTTAATLFPSGFAFTHLPEGLRYRVEPPAPLRTEGAP
jgi:hypothetical protein